MLTILAAAILAAPQEARLDRVPFQPNTERASLGRAATPAPDGAFLGVAIEGGPGATDVARVASVVPGSAADRAGLRAGDVIVSIDGASVATGAEVSAAIASRAVGDAVRVVVSREDRQRDLEIVLGRRAGSARVVIPSDEEAPLMRVAPRDASREQDTHTTRPGFLGLMAEPSDKGLLVRGVNPGGPAERAGLEAGDVLIEVDGSLVVDVDGLIAMLGEKGAGTRVELVLERDGERLNASVELGARPGFEAPGLQDGAPTDRDTAGTGYGAFPADGLPGQFRLEDFGGGRGWQFWFDDREPTSEEAAALHRDFRRRMNEMAARHRAERAALLDEMHKAFEKHGGVPRGRFDALDRFPGLLAPQDFRALDPRVDVDALIGPGGLVPRIQQRIGARADSGTPGGVAPNARGEQRIVEIEQQPDGTRVERTRRAELRDGRWVWVEENVEKHPPGAPDTGAAPLAPSAPSAPAAPMRDASLDAAIEALRRQIDELERRAARATEY